MAFNPDQDNPKVHYLCKIELDGYTLRVADVDIARSDQTLWIGIMSPTTTIAQDLGSLLEPKYISGSFTVTLDNKDDAVRDLFEVHEWANRPVTIEIGESATAANYSEWAKGVVRFPGGVSYTQGQAIIVCDDIRERDSLNLPTTRFDPATYTNMETKSRYKTIPTVYGDWRTTAGGGETIPAYQIDSTVGTGGSFKIASHALKGIEVVYLNGASVSFTITSLNNATFTLNVAYSPASDEITVNCQGATDDGTSAGNMIESPKNILNDILITRLGLSSGDLDAASFTSYNTNTSSIKVRRWIGGSSAISSNTLIQQLMIETFSDLTLISNTYAPVYRTVSSASSLTNFYHYDIQRTGKGPEGQTAFEVLRDPDRLYANRVTGGYRFKPVEQEFAEYYTFEDTAAQTNVLTVRERPISFYWIYGQSDCRSRIELEVYVFGTAEVEVAATVLTNRALLKVPTNQFGLIFDKYGDEVNAIGTPFQIRRSERRMGQLSNRVRAWNILNLTPGRWTGSTATTWLLSTAYERQSQGYWCDASGFADTSGSPDATSKRSRWF